MVRAHGHIHQIRLVLATATVVVAAPVLVGFDAHVAGHRRAEGGHILFGGELDAKFVLERAVDLFENNNWYGILKMLKIFYPVGFSLV